MILENKWPQLKETLEKKMKFLILKESAGYDTLSESEEENYYGLYSNQPSELEIYRYTDKMEASCKILILIYLKVMD